MTHIISLGGGVQSSTMALMAAKGEITPMPKAAVFADTQAEPKSVYTWLEWLTAQLPFPVEVVTAGDLSKTALTLRTRPSGTGQWTKSVIPAYTLDPTGKKGHMQRVCTYDYKVRQLIKAQRRIGQVRRGQKIVSVSSWIGISTDEAARMKPSREPWVEHRWPLIELGMSRQDCLDWMRTNGFPTPPRSACVFCPFHSDREWMRLRDEEPSEFAVAVQFEQDLQRTKAQTDNMRGVPYLHNSRVPLSQVVFKDDPKKANDWNNECEGLCGV